MQIIRVTGEHKQGSLASHAINLPQLSIRVEILLKSGAGKNLETIKAERELIMK